MFSKPLLKQTIKSNWKIFLVFTAVLALYLSMVCAVFTPKTLGDMQGLMEALGPISNLFGQMNDVIHFIGQVFYGMVAVIFPMIYCIIIGNRLIAAQVDRGAMVCLLSTPTKRNQITLTSALFFVLSLVVMFGFLAVFGIGVCAVVQPDALNVKAFLLLNTGCFLLMFATSGICFAASCVFNLSKYSLALGAGIPLAFFLIQMMAQLSEDLEFLKYATMNILFDPDAIIAGDGYAASFVVLAVIGLVLYGAGIKVFREKDLPL